MHQSQLDLMENVQRLFTFAVAMLWTSRTRDEQAAQRKSMNAPREGGSFFLTGIARESSRDPTPWERILGPLKVPVTRFLPAGVARGGKCSLVSEVVQSRKAN